MALLIYIVLLFVHSTRSDCRIDNRNREVALEEQLHKDLLSCYHISESPKPNGTVEVKVIFSIKYYNYDSDEEVFMINTWLSMIWQDERLRWNASDYDGINETILMSTRIWTRGIRLFNVADQDDNEEYFFTPCRVKSDGLVRCVPRTIFRARCSTKLTNWPLDSQTCLLKFGEWHTHGDVRYKFKEPSIFIKRDSGYWKIVTFDSEDVATSDIHLRLKFYLRRDALSLVPVVIHPCVILSVFTSVCLFLDVRGNLRLTMICFCLACHIYLMSSLNIHIPKHSADPPRLLFYYRGSIIITTIGIIITFILDKICKRKSTPPLWLSSANEVMLKGREKIILWPLWSCNDGSQQQEWVDIANFVNIMYFLISIVGYISMYFSFVP